MMLSTISILGVDDSVSARDLEQISNLYPFVEWGINLHSSIEPQSTYPSEEWLEELSSTKIPLRIRAVLHGRWESDMLDGNLSLKTEQPKLWDYLSRIQVDIRKGPKNVLESLQLIPDKEVILRARNPNRAITGAKLDANHLLPKAKLFTYPEYCGYAISEKDIGLILQPDTQNNSKYWISVDGFRKNNGSMDLLKVERFLDTVEEKIQDDIWFKSLVKSQQKPLLIQAQA